MNVADLPPVMASKAQVDGACWRWTGAITSAGYGNLKHEGKPVLAHRLAYELLVAPIPAGLTIDHLCRNRWCINPVHLEPVTQRENNRRKPKPSVCPQGHPLTGENVWLHVNKRRDRIDRRCRKCKADQHRAWRTRRDLGVAVTTPAA